MTPLAVDEDEHLIGAEAAQCRRPDRVGAIGMVGRGKLKDGAIDSINCAVSV